MRSIGIFHFISMIIDYPISESLTQDLGIKKLIGIKFSI